MFRSSDDSKEIEKDEEGKINKWKKSNQVFHLIFFKFKILKK